MKFCIYSCLGMCKISLWLEQYERKYEQTYFNWVWILVEISLVWWGPGSVVCFINVCMRTRVICIRRLAGCVSACVGSAQLGFKSETKSYTKICSLQKSKQNWAILKLSRHLHIYALALAAQFQKDSIIKYGENYCWSLMWYIYIFLRFVFFPSFPLDG